MKRKLICAVIPFLLSASLLSGCGTSQMPDTVPDSTTQDEAAASPEDNNTSNDADDNTEEPEIPSDTFSPSGEEDSQNAGEVLDLSEFSAMEKAIDSLMLCSIENDLSYDSRDSFFFWSSLYYGIVNYVDEISLAEEVEEGIRVPRMAVQEFATGLFADYDDLPEIPEELSIICYDEAWDAYLFLPSDRGLIETRLLNASANEDGSIRLAAALYDSENDTLICSYTFTLVMNPYADGIEDPLFPYSISSMTRSDAVNSKIDLPTLIGSYQGFSDNHTVEFKVDGNLIAFQVYDMDIISILSQLEENEELTFAVEIDDLTESKTIVSIIMK